MILLCEKGAHGDSARCEQVCMHAQHAASKGARAVHSLIICISSPRAPLLQAKQTLLALSTWPAPAKRPVAIGQAMTPYTCHVHYFKA